MEKIKPLFVLQYNEWNSFLMEYLFPRLKVDTISSETIEIDDYEIDYINDVSAILDIYYANDYTDI